MDWLPELVPLDDYGGDFSRYVEAVYRIFRRDFVDSQPVYLGRPCRCDSRLDSDGKERGFWHVISEGSVESERVPAIRRCERIGWPRAIIEAAETYLVKVWQSTRKREGKGQESRICLAPEDFSYLVVLRQTAQAFIVITAYHLEHGHEREKKRKEYNRYYAENS